MRNKGTTITNKEIRRAIKALKRAVRNDDYRDFPRPYTISKNAIKMIEKISRENYARFNFFIDWPPSVTYKIYNGGKITMRDFKNMV
jgi:hypothetical protein